MEDFQFESNPAAFPIIGSTWTENPEDAIVTYQNAKSSELYGELRGHSLTELFSEVLNLSKFDLGRNGHTLMQRLLDEGCIRSVSGTLAGRRVEMFSTLQNHTPKSVQTTIIDTTDRYHDSLSGIPGRDLFYDHLDHELFRCMREKSEVHLCFIDLDGFKRVNDIYGHQAGDDVIVEVAGRLKKIIRRHEIVARFGGDEFVIMLTAPTVDSVFFAEKKLIPLLNEPYLGGEMKIDFIGASVGIASAPQHATDPDELVNFADDAMYVAKSQGKNRAVVFETGMEGMKKH